MSKLKAKFRSIAKRFPRVYAKPERSMLASDIRFVRKLHGSAEAKKRLLAMNFRKKRLGSLWNHKDAALSARRAGLIR